jgi:hypothetical protein
MPIRKSAGTLHVITHRLGFKPADVIEAIALAESKAQRAWLDYCSGPLTRRFDRASKKPRRVRSPEGPGKSGRHGTALAFLACGVQ